MPRRHARLKLVKVKGLLFSSAEDSEEQKNTNEIIQKLSSTFLSGRKCAKKKVLSRAVAESSPKKCRKSPRLTSFTNNKTAYRSGSDYDGDIETGSDSNTTPLFENSVQPYTSTPTTEEINKEPAHKSVEVYDFENCGDFPQLHLEISPCKPNTASKRSVRDTQTKIDGKQRKTEALQGALQSLISHVTKSSRHGCSKPTHKKETCTRNIQRKNIAKKNRNKKLQVAPDLSLKNIYSNVISSSSSGSLDSGIFMSPSSTFTNSTNTTSTPSITPSIIVKTNRHEESFIECTKADRMFHLPDVSPVKCVDTPSDVRGKLMYSKLAAPSSPHLNPGKRKFDEKEEHDLDSKVLNLSKAFANKSLIGMYDLSPQKSKGRELQCKKKRQKVSISKYDLMAAQLNEEFDQFDSYELDIE